MADTLAEGKNYRQEEIIGDLEDETLVEAVVNTITKDGGGGQHDNKRWRRRHLGDVQNKELVNMLVDTLALVEVETPVKTMNVVEDWALVHTAALADMLLDVGQETLSGLADVNPDALLDTLADILAEGEAEALSQHSII